MEINLTPEEIKEFLKLHKSLLFYVNQKKKIIKEWNELEDVQGNLEQVFKLREVIIKDLNWIDLFIKDNPFNFSTEQLNIIKDWKQGISGKFFITKYSQEYTYFYHSGTKKCYGVLSLTEQLKDMMGHNFPLMVEAWLIPYKNKVIYDSLIAPYGISFGGGMKRSLKIEYEEAILNYGLITSFNEQKKESISEIEMLKFYMKSEANRERYRHNIISLSSKSPELENVYYQELSRNNARYIKKQLQDNEVKGHFAILNNTVVASGTNNQELTQNIANILPTEKRNWIHKIKL